MNKIVVKTVKIVINSFNDYHLNNDELDNLINILQPLIDKGHNVYINHLRDNVMFMNLVKVYLTGYKEEQSNLVMGKGLYKWLNSQLNKFKKAKIKLNKE